MMRHLAYYALLIAMALCSAALADDPPNTPARRPVVRAPTQGKAMTTMMPSQPNRAMDSELFFAPTEEQAMSKPLPKRKRHCIATSSIRSADVRDDSTIRLTLGKNKQVDMKLYGICPGLSFDESFYYQPGPTMELCARFDTIVARSGSRCLIDAFVPVEQQPKK
jgi:hypothetical protein